MKRKNLLLLAIIAASSMMFAGCATTTNMKTVHEEFGAIDRTDAIKYAPKDYAQAEAHIHMADEECAEGGWLDLKECEEFAGIARKKMDEVRRKIADARKPAPKVETPPSPPAPAPVVEKPPTPAPVAPATREEPAPAPAPAPAATVKPSKEELKLMVHFGFDKDNIRADAAKKLGKVADFVKSHPNAKVKIKAEGHTCSIGTSEYNMGLSDRRANSVKKYLVKKAGIAADLIETVGYGEEKPARPNTTKKGRQYNRRAEISLTVE